MKTSVNYNNIESKKVQLDGPKGKVNGVNNEQGMKQQPQEIRDDYKVGDTVKWKVNGKTGIIEAICERDMGPYGRRNLYTVNFDKDTEFPTGVRSLGAKYLAEALEPCEPDGKAA